VKKTTRARAAATCAVLFLLAACNQDSQRHSSGEAPPPEPPTPPASQSYSVGGAVTGLAGTGLSLQINGGETVAVSGNGSFTFPTAIATGSSFAVTVATQPSNPAQVCTVSGGSGTINANVTNVAVVCSTNTYTLGGTVSGLVGSGLTLVSGTGESLSISGSGAFAFPTRIADGAAYNVVIASQPSGPLQTCVVTSGSGTITASDVNVSIACTVNRYTVGGIVSGLVGDDMVLNNGTEQLTVDANGSFSFPTALDVGVAYDISIDYNPGAPAQRCHVANGSGTLGAANVTNASIACDPPMYSTFMLAANSGNDSVSMLAADDDQNLRWHRTVPVGDTPVDVAIYNGAGPKHFAYVANYGSGNVSAFAYDAREGVLEEVVGSPYYSGTDPRKITVHPTLPFIYVFNTLSNVRAFSIDQTTGALTDRGAVTINAATVKVLIEPSGRYAYILADQVASILRTYSIDQTTGALTEVPSSAQPMAERSGGMTFDGDARHLYVFNPTTDTIHVYSLNASSGRPQPIAGSPFATGGADLEFLALHPSGRFIYAVPPASLRREEGITVFSLRGGATPTRVAGSPFSSGADASVGQVDPTGRYLYCAEPRMSGTLLNKYVVDTTTGALTSRSSIPAPYASNVQAPIFDATGERLYDANGVILSYGIDRATGTLLSSNWTTTQAAWGTSAMAIDTTSAPLEFVSDTVAASSEADARVSSFRLSTSGTLTPVSVVGLSQPRAISLDPLARVANVVSDYRLSFVGIDSGTSTLSAFPYDLNLSRPAPATFSSSGRYMHVPSTTSTTLRTYVIDLATGDLDSQLPNTTLQTAVEEAFVHPNGRLYTRPPADGTANQSRLWYYPIDVVTGQVDPNGNYFELNGPIGGWAIHPSNNFMYLVKPTDDVIESYSIAPVFGYLNALNADVPFVANGETALAMDPRGRFLFAITSTGTVQRFAIEADGRLTSLGDQVPSLTQATALGTDFSGNYLVVMDGGAARVRTYRVEDDGSLTHVASRPTLSSAGVHVVKVTGRLR
jgi:6-phosphogluconolactonase (cycloisomerase 2 family)